ncbi:hypothetical protein SLS63_012843 [Diaporthe eres]|uniref:Tat pathway signal sequence n=1 Tax=Diaporthe eres TaxID=83184 RepID=A0ABR1NQ39_DIAER
MSYSPVKTDRPSPDTIRGPKEVDLEDETMAQDQIEYRLEKTYASQDSPHSEYQGWPNDEIDRLWAQYEKGGSFQIDREMAERLPYATEHVAVEGLEQQYMGGLAVFHQLHCLNAIRKTLYPGRYNTSLVDADGTVNFHRWNHIDHCIEVVRRCITCHSDLAALTYDWVEDSQMVLHEEMLHTCRNFDLISEWAYARSFSVPMRAHVEEGKVVSYLDKPYGPAWEKVKTKKPDGWHYTKEDL